MFRWPAHVHVARADPPPDPGGDRFDSALTAVVLPAGALLQVATGFRAIPASPQPPA